MAHLSSRCKYMNVFRGQFLSDNTKTHHKGSMSQRFLPNEHSAANPEPGPGAFNSMCY